MLNSSFLFFLYHCMTHHFCMHSSCLLWLFFLLKNLLGLIWTLLTSLMLLLKPVQSCLTLHLNTTSGWTQFRPHFHCFSSNKPCSSSQFPHYNLCTSLAFWYFLIEIRWMYCISAWPLDSALYHLPENGLLDSS